MFNIGPDKILIILVVAMIVVGPKRLPELGRAVGRGLNELRKLQAEAKDMVQFDLESYVDDDLEEPVTEPPEDDSEPESSDGHHHAEPIIEERENSLEEDGSPMKAPDAEADDNLHPDGPATAP